MRMEDKLYQFWLHNLPGVGDATIGKLLLYFGDARGVFFAKRNQLLLVLGEKRLERIEAFLREWEPKRAYEELKEKKISFYTREDEVYPERLKKMGNPPYALYCLGELPKEERPAVAVIGARECSEYGSMMARAFAARLAGAGVCVISGMARGIDGIAQKAAVSEKNGSTYAVLGCGVDVCYPAVNRELYEQILHKKGGILSVFPPGTKPQRQLFPERNRIVAGLSDVLLVVEARKESGTWITVDRALEQGKSVYAVPGRLNDRLSDGCNLLIRQGAGIVLSPEDFLAEIRVLMNRREIPFDMDIWKKEQKEAVSVEEDRKAALFWEGDKEALPEGEEEGSMAWNTQKVFSFLDHMPKSPDRLLAEMEKAGFAISLSRLLVALVELCMEGRAAQVGGSYVKRTKT